MRGIRRPLQHHGAPTSHGMGAQLGEVWTLTRKSRLTRSLLVTKVGVGLGNGIVGFENVGGQIDAVTGRRVTFAAFPWRWEMGDGCIVRLVAILDPTGEYRIETGAGA